MKKIITIIGILFFTTKFFYATAQTDNTTDEGVEINGVIWATRNVGAPNTFVDNPENYGNYYLWEEAKTVCPNGWRLPTQSELELLIANGSTWTTQNDNKYGREFGDANNNVFLPATGYHCATAHTIKDVDVFGYYWSSIEKGNGAYTLNFNSSTVGLNNFDKTNGFFIRCVKDKYYTTSVNEILSEKERMIIGYFNILGQKLSEEPESGIFIILYDNGISKKIINLEPRF
jgi:uncharacterized protein (TIGR02145 family)